MRNLEIKEVQEVRGGNGKATETIKTNAQTALDTCGVGNVDSVTTDGFKCK
jgi:hypothetical protein